MVQFEFGAASPASDHSFDDDSLNGDTSNGSVGVTDQANEMNTTQEAQIKEVQEMAKRETRIMLWWKLVVVVTILATAATVSTGAYIFLKDDQESNYKESFNSFANTITAAVEVHKINLYSGLKSGANVISGTALSFPNSEFPMITVPAFEILGGSVRKQTGAELLVYAPKVEEEEVAAFNLHTAAYGGWYEESKALILASGEGTYATSDYAPGIILPFIYDAEFDEDGDLAPQPPQNAPYYPFWQMSPPPFSAFVIKANIKRNPLFAIGIDAVLSAREALASTVLDFRQDTSVQLAVGREDHDAFHAQFASADFDNAFGRPHSIFVQPVFRETFNTTSDIVGILAAVVGWDVYFANLLPEGVKGITGVLENTCGQAFSYYIEGEKAVYAGQGDLHDKAYDNMRVEIPFSSFIDESRNFDVPGSCVYTIVLYATKEFEEEYNSNLPLVMTIVVAATFFFMIVTFQMYDWFVQRRNNTVVGAAARANGILSSMFPKNVRDRLFAEKEQEDAETSAQKVPLVDAHGKTRLKTFMNSESRRTLMIDRGPDEDDDDFMYKTKPIADFFPETTIMFADISGFTAWSSAREPAQVFTLLETIYKAFDDIAKRRRVFKVETIGDCYVAVTGLPDPRKDHAVAMTRFARDCMHRMHQLVRKLEIVLGPDTADLSMRFGLHSGPVTAGVLRGERSRFQLFGDTMNTASRMESTGIRDRIQISQETADLLIEAGKSGWITPREEKIVAKGKGEMQTYWVAIGTSKSGSSRGGMDHSGSDGSGCEGCITATTSNGESNQQEFVPMSAKTERLIKWNADILANLLKQVQARRQEDEDGGTGESKIVDLQEPRSEDHTVLEEVKEIIHLPTYKGEVSINPDSIELGNDVMQELHEYVAAIASMYGENPFHNFEHASHVTMSVVKLLSRIVVPDLQKTLNEDMASTLHDHTYGITSDPLTQFACVFSALVHDVDHSGVPNTQLIKENSALATVYKNKSVAEQNSVDLSWDLLMNSSFDTLRAAIYSTDAEKKRFRQLVVNSVMATDIMDKDLKTLRNNRWENAFSEGAQERVEGSKDDIVDRKATVVIEHLIQASDISHTMQHWHIYQRWNVRLFEEMYKAYVDGRSDSDPSKFWYQGEIGFFDFYIIPLAKKLKDCGVFGVSSDEYLNYAMQNRKEWEERGHQLVAELVEATRSKLALEANKRGTILNTTSPRK